MHDELLENVKSIEEVFWCPGVAGRLDSDENWMILGIWKMLALEQMGSHV